MRYKYTIALMLLSLMCAIFSVIDNNWSALVAWICVFIYHLTSFEDYRNSTVKHINKIAEEKKNKLDAYCKNGFTREEALEIILDSD